jgi:hypothetical protein
MWLVGHVENIRTYKISIAKPHREKCAKTLTVKPHNRDHLEDPGIDKGTQLKWIWEKLNMRFRTLFLAGWLKSVKVTLPLTVRQSVSLGVEPHLVLLTRYLFLFDSYGLVFRGVASMTRGRVCHSYMLLALARAVFLGSESLGTRDHILLSQIWDFPFLAFYDSQGHGGGIRARHHTGRYLMIKLFLIRDSQLYRP